MTESGDRRSAAGMQEGQGGQGGQALLTSEWNAPRLKSLTFIECRTGDADMSQITARLPDELVASLDEAAARLRRTRAEVVRQAVEYYLEDFEDISRALEVLRDPADPLLDWEQAKRDLLGQH